MYEEIYDISFRCYYPNDPLTTNHRQMLKLSDIPRWIDSYKFTHPNCTAVTVKVWFDE